MGYRRSAVSSVARHSSVLCRAEEARHAAKLVLHTGDRACDGTHMVVHPGCSGSVLTGDPLSSTVTNMFINARNALTEFATSRTLSFPATVEHTWRGETVRDASGTSVEYLADTYNDAKSLWGNARIVSNVTGEVLFRG